MDAFVISGGRRLEGSVAIRGSKNACLPLLAAGILADGPCTFTNVPLLRDVQTQVKILNTLGIETSWKGRSVVTEVKDTYNSTAPYELVKQMRAGVCVLGPLIGRRGYARVSLPGGCVIGERPIDLHLRGLEALGAEVSIEHGYVEAREPKGGLIGAEIYLGGKFGPSVTATENIMCAAVLAKGTTIIECAACEPEVVDVANFLIAMGARIEGAGSPRITIRGVKRLRGCKWRVIPDRIETVTMVVLAAITRSPLTITNCHPDHLLAFLHVMRQMGVDIERGRGKLTVKPPKRPKACDFVTLPHPAFPTDAQAQTMALAALADGTSVITERIYPERFMHAAEMKRMGAQISVSSGQAVVQGVSQLSGTEVMASDLRASAALVLAALAAKGESLISRIYHIDRGYERIDERLVKLGANIRRIDHDG
jgi:UDP-N-acetylglucosamine 1-carboxyvinyltransferase